MNDRPRGTFLICRKALSVNFAFHAAKLPFADPVLNFKPRHDLCGTAKPAISQYSKTGPRSGACFAMQVYQTTALRPAAVRLVLSLFLFGCAGHKDDLDRFALCDFVKHLLPILYIGAVGDDRFKIRRR